MSNCKGGINEGVYNCFGEYDATICYHCKHNKQPLEGETSDCFVSFRDKIDELYQFLKGEKLPGGTECKMPKLSSDMAFTIIWLLQEHFHILPDNIEQCNGGKELFDCDSEGAILDDQYKNNATGKTLAKKCWGQWCDNCIPDVDYSVK